MILTEIVETKVEELEAVKSAPGYAASYAEMKERALKMPSPRDFLAAVSTGEETRIIAEVKKASPSKGLIRPDFDPVALAKEYEANGAAAISVLTDEKYFQGSLAYLAKVSESVRIPVLRKDFLIDEYQVYEARCAGADAVLLIVAILDDALLSRLLLLTEELGMSALVEVHDEEELDRAVNSGATLIGVNNRDLKTFQTEINTTGRLAEIMPEDLVLVSESGINTREDILRLKDAGADAFLVGEALAREKDAGAKLRILRGES